MQPADDSALLRQFAETQSDEAFAELVSRYINLVYSVALRQVGNPYHAEEIAQAVFIILARKVAVLRHEKALSSWLFQVTRLTANNFVRSETRRHRREQEAYMQTILNESGGGVWPQIAPLLDSAVASLREKDRRAVLLRFYEGRNLSEVGLALGASEAAAEKRVHRALEKLRNFFMKRGVSSTTAILAGTISANSVQAAPVALAKTTTALAITKGSIASASTLTLVQGTMKTMTWLKLKFAIGVSTAILAAGGVATVAISQTGGDGQLTPLEIFKKAQEAYASLSSYADEGKTVATVNGMTLTTTFTIKLARPNLYRIEWEQSVNPGYKNKGVVWSAGDGDFIMLGSRATQKEANKESALSSATGVSGDAAATIPGTFFKMHWGNQLGGPAANQKQRADEKVGNADCYVFASELKGITRTLWIGKNDFLIHQVKTVMSAEAMKAAVDKAAKVTGIHPQDIPQGMTSTETHMNIVVNKQFSPPDFQR
jgi:RNA polymerase sigma factor (sigma-70 family)